MCVAMKHWNTECCADIKCHFDDKFHANAMHKFEEPKMNQNRQMSALDA